MTMAAAVITVSCGDDDTADPTVDGGGPEIVVPDNLKGGVTAPCYYEPDINTTYADMAQHYGLAVIPARVRKPRDKGKVENGVLYARGACDEKGSTPGMVYGLALARDLVEHVLEERNARGELRPARAVQIQHDADLRLLRLALEFRFPHLFSASRNPATSIRFSSGEPTVRRRQFCSAGNPPSKLRTSTPCARRLS